MVRTIHGTKARSWADIHSNYKGIIGGVKYALVMDEHGATVLMPYKAAKLRRLV